MDSIDLFLLYKPHLTVTINTVIDSVLDRNLTDFLESATLNRGQRENSKHQETSKMKMIL
jgi:hypothetical protein